MTREAIKILLKEIAEDAASSKHYGIAAVLLWLCGSIMEGIDRDLADHIRPFALEQMKRLSIHREGKKE